MDRPNLKSIKDKSVIEYIDYLESQLKTPFAESYLAIKKIVEAGNAQIKKETFDIFDPSSDKKTAMVAKFLDSQQKYAEQMMYFKSKMTESEVKDLDKIALDSAPALERQVFKSQE